MRSVTVGTVSYPQAMITGRAATGIYLALRTLCPEGTVLVPANICYAAVYPILYSGRNVKFCDVEPISGNVSLDTLRSAWSSDIVAAIIPHMYGQPVSQMAEIGQFCRERGVFLIEDCASAMGAHAANYELGAVGDCVLFSTGYSKTLDLGTGGILCSRQVSLEATEEEEKKLPPLDNADEKSLAFFSKLYRFMRNQASDTFLEAEVYRVMYESCRGGFLYTIPKEKKDWILSQLQRLPQVIELRRKAVREYRLNLRNCPIIAYPYEEGAVPWRFNLFIEPELKQQVIDVCLAQCLPVSDWYPRVTNMFSFGGGDYRSAEWHEKHILNFPLLIEKDEIRKICETIRSCL